MFVLRFQNLPYMISRENQDFLQIFQQIMHVILGSHRKKNNLLTRLITVKPFIVLHVLMHLSLTITQ